jgi:phosphoglycolate phosphatase-like HAD superfamily hydrolase
MFVILFDIDGTMLCLKKKIAKDIFLQVLRDTFSIEIDKDIYVDFAGRTDYGIVLSIFNQLGLQSNLLDSKIDDVYRAIHHYFVQELSDEHIAPCQGVLNLLSLLHNDKRFALGVITGNFELNARLKLNLLGIDNYFQFGAYGDNQINRLKLPIIAINNAHKIYPSLIPDNCLIIGDTHLDIESAHHNNIKSLAVATGGMSVSDLTQFQPSLAFEDFSDYNQVYKMILKLFNLE